MNILVTLDRNYLLPLRVLLASLVINNPEEHFHFYLASDDLTEEDLTDIRIFLTRPTTLPELMDKCASVLNLEEMEALVVEEAEEEVKKRILVVDDSGILLRSVKTMLSDKYEVAVATDGKKAIERAKRRKPDLILLDYEMPVMDGKETLEELRKL